MPEPIVVTLLEHHNSDYRGPHEVSVHLVQLSDFLLFHADGVSDPGDLPVAHLRVLGVEPDQVLELAAQVFEEKTDLLALATLAATAS
jgi:hypothetical protein